MKRTHAERDAARRIATERVITESEARRATMAELAHEAELAAAALKKKTSKKKKAA